MNDATNRFDGLAYGRFNEKSSILVTARSIRRDLAINEKQGPTTTEMTTKSVSLESRMMLSRPFTLRYIDVSMRKEIILLTSRSIRRELAINEKQGPTTTEMTTKSVIWSHE